MHPEYEILPRAFYLREANIVAPELLGKLLIHRTPEGTSAGMIVEVEAYVGPEDKAAHTYGNRRTDRTEIAFGEGGYAYVFSIYGMHACFNVVVNGAEKPEVILVRALEPVAGLELMQKRRNVQSTVELCNGPGKLCSALGITREQYGFDLCGSPLEIAAYRGIEKKDIMVSPRINIDYAEEYTDKLWRYHIKDNPCVSRVAKRFRDRQKPMR
ncbi:MAG: DNA-3-methyladenine glycosylase [Oscillospiraceae bacterium]|nr:DNA-3-methyladenine glycosylase [Oscillospiraceae bacterium]